MAVGARINGPSESKQDIKKEKQSLIGCESALLMSAVAFNVCRNDPGQYTNTHNLPTKGIKRPEAAMTIHNTPDDLIGPPSLNPASQMHG